MWTCNKNEDAKAEKYEFMNVMKQNNMQ